MEKKKGTNVKDLWPVFPLLYKIFFEKPTTTPSSHLQHTQLLKTNFNQLQQSG